MNLRSNEGKRRKMNGASIPANKASQSSRAISSTSTTTSKDAWAASIANNDPEIAIDALKRGQIPEQSHLDNIVRHFGKRSEIVFHICKKICCLIRSENKNIENVWAAYCDSKGTPDIIYFVVISTENEHKERMIERKYNIVWRTLGQVNSEGKDVVYSKTCDAYLRDIAQIDLEKLKNSIDKNNIMLMKHHRNLTRISPSPVRSKGYGNKHILEKEPCIVLYVEVKGYIPINEDPFQKSYDGVGVDVREGLFTILGARDYQDTLKHGCQIARYKTGTLGGFITHPEFGTCGLTCAHVLLSPYEFRKFSQQSGVQDWKIRHSNNTVYQPFKAEDNRCGQLVRAIYQEGGGGESGLEIALFQIEKRYPDSGDFPVSEVTSLNKSYDSGNTAGVSRFGTGTVTKFGSATDETSGKAIWPASLTSVRAFKIYDDIEITLHNLLEIKRSPSFSPRDQAPFADFGDSGALVFCKGEANKLFCVGMLEGITSDNTIAVIPITTILQNLNVPGLKSFENNKIERDISEMKSSINQILTILQRNQP